MLLVPMTGISKPGSTREYPGNWLKGSTSSVDNKTERSSSGTGGDAVVICLSLPVCTSYQVLCVRSFFLEPGILRPKNEKCGLQPSNSWYQVLAERSLHTFVRGRFCSRFEQYPTNNESGDSPSSV